MNSADYKQKYNNASTGLFKDNSSGDIGANDARALVVDTGDNFVNFETDAEKYVRQGTASGTDAYAVTVSSPATAYTNTNLFVISFTNAASGVSTLNVNSAGAKKIYSDPSTQATAGDILAGRSYQLRYETALDSGVGGFLMISGGGGGGGGSTPTFTEVLTANNDAGGFSLLNVAAPTNDSDAATKAYVDTVTSGLTQDIASVLGAGNDAGGTTITNLPTPSAGSDAATKTYVDGVASGSSHLADFTTLTDAAPVAVDCNSLKEPKFYLSTGTSRTLDITEVRADSVLNNYVTILFLIKKTVAGDITITLDTSYTNKDLATDGSATSYLLSGASNSYFKLTAIVKGEASGCIFWWNLVSVSGGGGGGAWGTITGTLSAQTDLQAALDAIDTDITNHIADTTAAHAASAISYSAGGTVSATDVQAAIAEVASEKLALSGGTMTGNIAYGGAQKNTGLAAGSSAGDSVRYEQVIGVQDLFIPSAAMWPRVTAGCSPLAQSEMTTSLFNVQSLDFNQTTQQYAQFQITLPRKYNNSTVTFRPYWTAASGTGGVVWELSGGAYSDDDALTVALGTAQSSTDTFITANDLHIGAESSAITLAGSPADADFLAFQISRVTGNGSDTLTADAKLLGVSIRITTDAGVDA